MNRPATSPDTPGRADRWIRRTATVTVAGLAGIAGALSYSHMRQLAEAHGQAGWHAHTLPLSVVIEIVASLALLADRRTGCRSGWLPWAALIIGTAASLAANVATAQPDAISRVIAGWPALALLIAVKLLSGMLDHGDSGDRPATASRPVAVPDSDQSAAQDRPQDACAVPAVRPAATRPSAHARTGPAGDATATRPGRHGQPGDQAPAATRVADDDIAALLPAARAARDQLHRDGSRLTRDALAATLRSDGHQVRNARLTALLAALRAEPDTSLAA